MQGEIFQMKSKNRVQQYFYQKDLSVAEIISLSLAAFSLLAATFVTGGGPVGLPALVICIVAFCVFRSLKVKDSEIDEALKKILSDNQIKCTESTIEGYDLKDTVVKRRKNGKIISPRYYITDIVSSTESTVLNVYEIDLINSTVNKRSYDLDRSKKIILTEETVKTPAGTVQASYLNIDGECLIPVALNDYRSSQLVQEICDTHR